MLPSPQRTQRNAEKEHRPFFLRVPLRLWCGSSLHHGLSVTLMFLTGLPSLSVKRRHPDQSTFSFTILNTIVLTPVLRVMFAVLSWSLSAGRASSFLNTSLPLRYTFA